MSKRIAQSTFLFVIVLGSFTVTAAAAQTTQKPGTTTTTTTQKIEVIPQDQRPFPSNVRVEVTITDQMSPSATPVKKSVSLTCYRNSSIRSGVNVPVPSTTFGAAKSGDTNVTPVTSYSMRAVGLNVDVRDVEVRDNQVRLQITVEYSPLDDVEKASTGMQSYGNFSQSFYLVLDNGKPILAAQTSDPVPGRDRKLSVELKATILK